MKCKGRKKFFNTKNADNADDARNANNTDNQLCQRS